MNTSKQYTNDEIEFAKVIMGYWTNFAKTGYRRISLSQYRLKFSYDV